MVVVLLLAALVFAGSLWAPFHFDDWSLAGDPGVAHPEGWWRIPAGYAAPEATGMPARTRPLTYLTFWLQWTLGALQPGPSHAINLALHLLNIWLAWLIASRLLDQRIADVCVAVFAIHPVQVEPVVYVFARSTLLSSAFGLAALALWQRNRFAPATLALVAAIFSKEDAAAWLGVLFLYELIAPSATLTGTGRKTLAVFVGTSAAVYAFWRVTAAAAAIPQTGVLGDAPVTPLGYLATQGVAIWHYVGLLTTWSPLNVDHDLAAASSASVLPWLGWLAVVAASGAIALYWRRSPVTWAAASACVLLMPTSTVLPLADALVERRMYTPILFAAIAAMAMLAPPPTWLRPWWIRGALVVVLAGMSMARVYTWQSEARLWRDSLEHSPDKARPWLQWAAALERESPAQRELRQQALEQAIAIDSSAASPWLQMGVFWLQSGDPARASESFEGAGLRGASPAVVQANLGAAMFMAGRVGRAQQLFLEALNYDRCHWDARNNLILANRNLPAAQRRVAPADTGCVWTARQSEALAAAGAQQ